MKKRNIKQSNIRFADEVLNTLGNFLNLGIKEPEILDKIPNNSYIALLPKENKKFSKKNLELVTKAAKRAKTKVFPQVFDNKNINAKQKDPRQMATSAENF